MIANHAKFYYKSEDFDQSIYHQIWKEYWKKGKRKTNAIKQRYNTKETKNKVTSISICQRRIIRLYYWCIVYSLDSLAK